MNCEPRETKPRTYKLTGSTIIAQNQTPSVSFLEHLKITIQNTPIKIFDKLFFFSQIQVIITSKPNILKSDSIEM